MSIHSPAQLVAGWLSRLRYDGLLLGLLAAICTLGLAILYSATGGDADEVISQGIRLLMGMAMMLFIAQFPPDWLRVFAPWLFGIGIILLILVEVMGDHAMGAVRWLDLGFVRFQPAEIMKLAVPMTLAAMIHYRGYPARLKELLMAGVLLCIPAVLVIIQPDLGTAILIIAGGGFVMYLGGIAWRWFIFAGLILAAALPIIWFNLHDYQQERVLTFLNPGRDPMGAGYHIIQSTIAVGSGGVFGKGWMQGTQAQLRFLPEANTDFILAVFAEEAGLIGVCVLLLLYLAVVARSLAIALRAQDTFQRLLGGGLAMTFFLYLFINMGMVIGILPVVGVPLPLVSDGGTSAIVLLAGFGMLMSIHTHRKLVTD